MTDQITVSNADKASIVLAAINAVGPAGDRSPEEWEFDVASKSADIYLLAHNDRSTAVKAIESVANAKVFPATILAVTKEQSSTRGLVKMKTRPSNFHPDGIEEARTERTDRPDGKALANSIRSLIGHKVLIWIELESINDGATKVRVIRHFKDLGPDNSGD